MRRNISTSARRLKSTLLILLLALIAAPTLPTAEAQRSNRTSASSLREPLRAQNGMVASTSRIASEVGVDVLRRGGNAVDASIAVAFALAVTYPAAGNLGGGGFMMIRLRDGREIGRASCRERV